MKLDSGKFAIAGGATAGIFWIICSLLVWLMPEGMMSISEYMTHTDYTNMSWHHIDVQGLLFGLIAWVIVSAVTCWFFAAIYNKLIA